MKEKESVRWRRGMRRRYGGRKRERMIEEGEGEKFGRGQSECARQESITVKKVRQSDQRGRNYHVYKERKAE